MKGRKPKPTALHILNGNPSKLDLDEKIKTEPKPIQIVPECPDWLLDEAKKEWNRLAPELERLGLLTIIDEMAFAGLYQSYAKFKAAERFLKKNGTTYRIPKKNKEGEIVSVYIAPFPEVAIANQCLKHIRAFVAEFGLIPSSIRRIYLPGESFEDEYEKFLNSKMFIEEKAFRVKKFIEKQIISYVINSQFILTLLIDKKDRRFEQSRDKE